MQQTEKRSTDDSIGLSMKTIKPLLKKLKGIMLTALVIFVVCILIVTGIVWAYSPGKPEPYLDETGNVIVGSLSEKVFVTIGGVKQGMFIKSKDATNPVLLYVHGGLPLYFLTQEYPTGLEDQYTVVWWDQRGSGISYSADIPPETMNLEQMINDTREVTNYLRKRFGKEKIYLMGHSGGTYIGIQTAAQNPELYHAYIGVAQMSDQLRSERLGYEYMLKQYKAKGNSSMVRKLESAPVVKDLPEAYLKLRDKAMHTLGIGTTHDMNSVITGVFKPSLKCRDYTLREKINLWQGKSRSGVHPLWDEMLATNLILKVPRLDVPTYFFSGVYDYTVSYPLTKDYFEKLDAPIKGFYTFEKSAHSPFLEEPERMQQILKEDVLKGLINLADKP